MFQMYWVERLPEREAHSSGLQHGKQNVTAVEKNQFSICLSFNISVFFFSILVF